MKEIVTGKFVLKINDIGFYSFRQNNTGGRFKQPAVEVLIEAYDNKHANEIAETKGIYFDGCDNGTDCECCGDRWSRAWGSPDYVGLDGVEFSKYDYGIPDRIFHYLKEEENEPDFT